jgi:ABC-type hemin transport system substrate-binding protein
LLFLASFVIVIALVLAIADGIVPSLARQQTTRILFTGIAVGGVIMAVAMTFLTLRRHGFSGRKARDEVAELRKNLLTAEAIIKAEPQVLVFWDQGHGAQVVAHTLSGVEGLPALSPQVLRFGKWLDLASAQELKKGLDALFAEGRPFNLLLRTGAGGHLEADGRAAGGRAILLLRDVAGR